MSFRYRYRSNPYQNLSSMSMTYQTPNQTAPPPHAFRPYVVIVLTDALVFSQAFGSTLPSVRRSYYRCFELLGKVHLARVDPLPRFPDIGLKGDFAAESSTPGRRNAGLQSRGGRFPMVSSYPRLFAEATTPAGCYRPGRREPRMTPTSLEVFNTLMGEYPSAIPKGCQRAVWWSSLCGSTGRCR